MLSFASARCINCRSQWRQGVARTLAAGYVRRLTHPVAREAYYSPCLLHATHAISQGCRDRNSFRHRISACVPHERVGEQRKGSQLDTMTLSRAAARRSPVVECIQCGGKPMRKSTQANTELRLRLYVNVGDERATDLVWRRQAEGSAVVGDGRSRALGPTSIGSAPKLRAQTGAHSRSQLSPRSLDQSTLARHLKQPLTGSTQQTIST